MLSLAGVATVLALISAGNVGIMLDNLTVFRVTAAACDAGGRLAAFSRMDGACAGSGTAAPGKGRA